MWIQTRGFQGSTKQSPDTSHASDGQVVPVTIPLLQPMDLQQSGLG